MSSAFNPIRDALLVMLHEARRFNAATIREAGIGPFDLVAVRQAEEALTAPTPPVDAVLGEPVAHEVFSDTRIESLYEAMSRAGYGLPSGSEVRRKSMIQGFRDALAAAYPAGAEGASK